MSGLGCASTGVASIQAKETRGPRSQGRARRVANLPCAVPIAQPSALRTLTTFRSALALGLVLGLWALLGSWRSLWVMTCWGLKTVGRAQPAHSAYFHFI